MLVDASGNSVATEVVEAPINKVISKLKEFTAIGREATPENQHAARIALGEAMCFFAEATEHKARNGHDYVIEVTEGRDGLNQVNMRDISPRGKSFLAAWEQFTRQFQQASVYAQLEEGIRVALQQNAALSHELNSLVMRVAALELGRK